MNTMPNANAMLHASALLNAGTLPDRSLSRRKVADRLSWLWLLAAIMVLALGAFAGGRKW